MKRKIFTFLLIAAAGLTACKKTENQPEISVYDEQQIQAYLSANGLTGFTADTTKDSKSTSGTTGIQYKIISQGTGDSLQYSTNVSIVYTVKTFDGKYVSSDTIVNHFVDYLGHLTADNLPKGLQLAIHNILKYPGSNMRLMIPSRLAYGVNGYGSGSITNVNTRIAGNQCLDYYVHVIGDQGVYDDKVINNYIASNNLTGYLPDPAGYYYKIITAGTKPVGEIKEFSNVTNTYKGMLLNGTVFADKSTASTETPFTYSGITGLNAAVQKYGAEGASLSFIFPSALGYGTAAQNDGTVSIPSNSCTRFDYQITTVTQP